MVLWGRTRESPHIPQDLHKQIGELYDVPEKPALKRKQHRAIKHMPKPL